MYWSRRGPGTGRAGIRELMAPRFDDPKATLRWEPTFAAVSKSGDLGYTTGNPKGARSRTESSWSAREIFLDLAEAEGQGRGRWRSTTIGVAASGWMAALDPANECVSSPTARLATRLRRSGWRHWRLSIEPRLTYRRSLHDRPTLPF